MPWVDFLPGFSALIETGPPSARSSPLRLESRERKKLTFEAAALALPVFLTVAPRLIPPPTVTLPDGAVMEAMTRSGFE